MREGREQTLPEEKPAGRAGFWDSPRQVLSVSVFVTVLVVVGWYLFAPMDSAMSRIRNSVALSRMKVLQLASQQRAMDGFGYPGDTGESFAQWAESLVKGKYLSTNDLALCLSTMDAHRARMGQLPMANTNGILVYGISTNSPADAVVLSSWNFVNSPAGGTMSEPRAPFALDYFAVMHKAGDGALLRSRAAGHPERVGGYVPLLR